MAANANTYTDGGSKRYPYANYQDKYDILLSGVNDNMIAFLELYGMSDYVEDRLWQIYDSKMVMRYRADAPELKNYTDPTLASTYTGRARDISDIYLDGYDIALITGRQLNYLGWGTAAWLSRLLTTELSMKLT